MALARLVDWTAAALARPVPPAAWLKVWLGLDGAGGQAAAWVERELPVRMAARQVQPWLSLAEVLQVVRWALGPAARPAAARLGRAGAAAVEEAVRRAFAQRWDPAAAFAALVAIPGCGPRLAAALLTAGFPSEYGCLPPGDLAGEGDPHQFAAYTRLLRLQARALTDATPLPWTPAMVARTLPVLAAPSPS